VSGGVDPKGDHDIAVVGAGILGLAVARTLAVEGHNVCVLERNDRVGMEQTGHNSGVIHAGVYYAPRVAEGAPVRRGARAMYEYCEQPLDRPRALRQADRGP